MVAIDADRAARGDLSIVDEPAQFHAALDRLAAGEGPVAVDTERASGYRYSDRAYLIQVFRRGSGTVLIDPLPFDTLAPLGEAIGDSEWILHAATQDLPSLRGAGLDPGRLFDTELASRLLGKPRVGLGAVVKELLDIDLAKAHSADDWSRRPLPVSWLAYAALDVELLVDVRDALDEQLVAAGKREWAQEEFADILHRDLTPRREERWRRLSGAHSLRSARQLAVARELWLARDAYARETDTAPGRIVPDRALAAAAKALPRTRGQLAGLPDFTGRESRSQLDRWWAAVDTGLRTDDLPSRTAHDPDRLPPPRAWAQRNPEADVRLHQAKPAVAQLAADLDLPTENLLTPSLLRRVAWSPAGEDADSIADQLRALGAREWQVSRTAPVISAAFVEAGQDDPGVQTGSIVSLS